MPFFIEHLGKPALEKVNCSSKARDDEVEIASDGPYANNL